MFLLRRVAWASLWTFFSPKLQRQYGKKDEDKQTIATDLDITKELIPSGKIIMEIEKHCDYHLLIERSATVIKLPVTLKNDN